MTYCRFCWLQVWLDSGVQSVSSEFLFPPLLSFAYLCLISISDRLFLSGGKMAPGFSNSSELMDSEKQQVPFAMCLWSTYGSDCARCPLCVLPENPPRKRNPPWLWESAWTMSMSSLPSDFWIWLMWIPGRILKGGRRVRLGYSFPLLLPWDVPMGWLCPSTEGNT